MSGVIVIDDGYRRDGMSGWEVAALLQDGSVNASDSRGWQSGMSSNFEKRIACHQLHYQQLLAMQRDTHREVDCVTKGLGAQSFANA